MPHRQSLTPEMLAEANRRRQSGEQNKTIAADLGVSPACLSTHCDPMPKRPPRRCKHCNTEMYWKRYRSGRIYCDADECQLVAANYKDLGALNLQIWFRDRIKTALMKNCSAEELIDALVSIRLNPKFQCRTHGRLTQVWRESLIGELGKAGVSFADRNRVAAMVLKETKQS